MKIDVHFTPLGLAAGDLAGRGVVVVDVLRATTTIVTALAHGAKAVIPAATSEDAVRLATNLEKDGVVLAGERRSVKIEGVALGYSPREMSATAVAGKTIVLATTNGTPALADELTSWQDALEGSEAAHQLADVDLGEDVAFAAQADRFGVVPVYADRRIT